MAICSMMDDILTVIVCTSTSDYFKALISLDHKRLMELRVKLSNMLYSVFISNQSIVVFTYTTQL